MRFELFSTIAAFGGSSAFLLLLAFVMPAKDYGTLMQCQAVFLLITAVFSFRTYDLFFYLQKNYGYDETSAYAQTFCYEWLLVGLSFTTLCVARSVFEAFGYTLDFIPLLFVPLALLSSIVIVQGTAQAVIRAQKQDNLIAFGNLLQGGAFGAAFLYVLLAQRLRIDILLLILLAANAIRPVFLCLAALTLGRIKNPIPSTREIRFKLVASYLFSGQLTNFLKNNLISVETLLLGWGAGAESVAVYRLARSFLNFVTTLLNIIYQRTYRALLSIEGTGKDLSKALKRVDAQSVKIWAGATPVVLFSVWTFVWLKNDASYQQLLLVVLLLSVVILINALQQSLFANNALQGNFGIINKAYCANIAVLILGYVLVAKHMPMYGFIAMVFTGALVRYFLLYFFQERNTRAI